MKTERTKFVDLGELAAAIGEHSTKDGIVPLDVILAAIRAARPRAGVRVKLLASLPRVWGGELAGLGVIQYDGCAYAYGATTEKQLRRLLAAWEAYRTAPAGLRHTFDAEEIPLLFAGPALDAIGSVFARFGLDGRQKLRQQVPEGGPREAEIEAALDSALAKWR